VSAGQGGPQGPVPAAGEAEARLIALNQQLAARLGEAEDRVRTSTRLLDDMSRSIGPDVLTRLPNRVLLLDRLVQATATASFHHTRLALLLVQIGNFRMVVEQFGRESANALLRLIAGRIRDTLGTIETVSRHEAYGFLVLLPEVFFDDADSVGQRILSALDALLGIDGSMPHLKVGIGVAFFPDHGQSPLDLVGSAEAAARHALHSGSRAIVIFDRSMRQPPSFPLSVDVGLSKIQPPDEALLVTEGSPLQAYMCEANEQLLMASLTSLERKELAEQALQRQTDFLAVLAHELRTPLTPISLASAMMSDVGSDQIPRLQDVINRQIVHISRLLTDLLEVARINTGKVRLQRESVSIANVIEQAIDTCMPTIKVRSQLLTSSLPKGMVRVLGDPVRLAQIFTNLLDNASKYTPEHGAIGVQVEADEKWVRVTVTDSGIGISPDSLSDIFEPFVQDRTAVAHNGTGLGIGLTVVRDMCKAHGGRVEAYSEGANTGASFVVTLARMSDSGRQH